MTYGFGKASLALGIQDAFARVRVSDANTQFESKFTYGDEPFLFNTTTTNGGLSTFLINEAAWNLTTTSAAGSKVVRESANYMQYHPGKSQLVFLTGVIGEPTLNCVKRVGYFDNADGLYFIQNGTLGFGVARRTSTSGSPVDNITYQADWNIDRLDGTGPSRITLDLTKAQIFVIEFQWLGVGAVKYGFDIDGILIYVHQSNHANQQLTQVYMKSGWLPVRYEIENTGASTSNTLKQICSAVISEGGIEQTGEIFAVTGTGVGRNAPTNTWTPVISIRVNTTRAGVPFRGKIQITNFQSVVTSNNYATIAVVENPSLVGASWTTHNTASSVQVDTSATSFTGGSFRSMNFNGKTSSESSLAANEMVGYAGSIFTLCARGIDGTAATLGAFNWREII